MNVGFETLTDYQNDTSFIDKLANLVDKYKELDPKVYANSTKAKELNNEMAELIYKRFGIPVDIKFNSKYGYACIPLFIADNAYSKYGAKLNDIIIDILASTVINGFFAGLFNMLYNLQNIKEFNKYLDEIKKKLDLFYKNNVYVDLKKARIYNWPKEAKAQLFLGSDIIDKNNRLSSHEIAAIILHEIGHIFTFTYMHVRFAYNTTPLLDAFIEVNNGNIDKAKRILIKKYDIKDQDLLADSTRESIMEAISRMLLKGTAHKTTLANNKAFNKDSEIDADDFAIRMGAGSYLSNGLAKLNGYITGKYFYNILTNYLVFVVIAILFSGASIIFVVRYGLMYIIATLIKINILEYILDISNTYMLHKTPHEKPLQRVKRIKQQLIRILRTEKNNKSIRKLIKQIESIEKNIAELENKPSSKTIMTLLMSPRRFGKDYDPNYLLTIIMSNLENNDLHYLSEKLKLKDRK